MSTISERFNHLFKVISSKRFLDMEGLGNEVPFFICPYPPEDGVEMEKMVRENLVRSLAGQGIQVVRIDLYDLAIDLLKERGIFEQILEQEQALDKEELKELLQGTLDPEAHIVPAIAERMKQSPSQVLFITGVGEVFPYIRSHNILNNLQSTVTDQPMVLFFPGVYSHSRAKGASLDLFGRLQDDKYYRAFNIFHAEV